MPSLRKGRVVQKMQLFGVSVVIAVSDTSLFPISKCLNLCAQSKLRIIPIDSPRREWSHCWVWIKGVCVFLKRLELLWGRRAAMGMEPIWGCYVFSVERKIKYFLQFFLRKIISRFLRLRSRLRFSNFSTFLFYVFHFTNFYVK